VRGRKVLFWDFDGVVKESVDLKGAAFEQLFAPFGHAVASRVRAHHDQNGGLSRFVKLPLYLEWAGQSSEGADVSRYAKRFSELVRTAVINADWVPGVWDYLHRNHLQQFCVLVTATPQSEIEEILRALNVEKWFREVHGSPTPKASAITSVLHKLDCSPSEALMIGDSESDLKAAEASGVPFLLRRTGLNSALQASFKGDQCEDFRDF
jgi:phosphoglycolate phosphatase-like HAD superfamily hydrolase